MKVVKVMEIVKAVSEDGKCDGIGMNCVIRENELKEMQYF